MVSSVTNITEILQKKLEILRYIETERKQFEEGLENFDVKPIYGNLLTDFGYPDGNYRGKEGENFLLALSQQNIKVSKEGVTIGQPTKVVVAKKKKIRREEEG